MNRNRLGHSLVAGAAALGLGVAAITGCSSDPASSGKPAAAKLSVEHPYMPLPASDTTAAGYFTIRNTGGTDDRLVKVTSSLTDDVTMHHTSGGHMEEVHGWDIPAGGELRLSRGGNHLMFMGLKEKPRLGQKVEVRLEFANSAPMEVEMPVKELTYRPPTGE